jgi:hypothetical protein
MNIRDALPGMRVVIDGKYLTVDSIKGENITLIRKGNPYRWTFDYIESKFHSIEFPDLEDQSSSSSTKSFSLP